MSDWQRKASEAESALAASKAREAVTARELSSMQVKLHEAQGLAEVSRVNSAYNRTPGTQKTCDCKEMCLQQGNLPSGVPGRLVPRMRVTFPSECAYIQCDYNQTLTRVDCT